MKEETETGAAGWKNPKAWKRALAWVKRVNREEVKERVGKVNGVDEWGEEKKGFGL
jgi:hypothetical protein